MEKNKEIISSPDVNTDAMNEVFDNMYITNVEKRLRELNAPSDIDKKRWVWELIQNAKDTIALDPNRNEINVRIEINGDTVKFRHDGAPFTAKARYGLLYKYSGGKENQESTGRFGTGFLTTHCLSKIVTIESNMYSNKSQTELCGFEVTMYRDGLVSSELIDGLKKMRASEHFFKQTFDWTTFTYHVNTDSGRTAVKLGIENFHENIAQTMLFCKEIKSIELNDNGKITKIVKLPHIKVTDDIILAEYEIVSSASTCKRRFLYLNYSGPSKELSERYRADRLLRLDVAVEIDENNNLVNHIGKTSHFCVLPLVGIEEQLNEPVIVNSPDFEPDSERQSLMLSGQQWMVKDDQNIITETGINQMIYAQVFPLYEKLVSFLSERQYGCLYYLANGLDKTKTHKNLDKDWYVPNVIQKYRDVLLKYPVVKSYDGTCYKKLEDCIIVKEGKESDESALYEILSALYSTKLVTENHEWAKQIWKSGINLWNTEDVCSDVENKINWSNIILTGKTLAEWYNKFLKYVVSYDERLLKGHALLPDMNGLLRRKDTNDFKQGEHVTPFIIELLYKLGKDVKPTLLHDDIVTVSLDAKYNSQSYSADINKLARLLLDNSSPLEKLEKVLPLLSVIPTDTEKYSVEFIKQRKDFFDIAKSLFSLTDLVSTEDNNLLESAWKEVDTWFVSHVLNSLKNIGSLTALPQGLDACWLNNTLKSLKVEISRLNTYEVLPNQNGKFCAQNKLYEDSGIPDSLKNSIFNGISLTYKDVLLDKNIDAAYFAINQKKNISSFASELKDRFASQSSYYSNYPYLINGRYFKYEQTTMESVALYVLSLIPFDLESEVGIIQKSIYTTAINILGSDVVSASESINYSTKDLWQDSNLFVVSMISNKIKSAEKIEEFDNRLGSKGEVYVFEQLNSFYKFLQSSNISYSAPKIFPNQEGEFCSINDLKKEEGSIEDIIKNIIYLLVDENEDYRRILMDKRCNIQPQAILNSDNAYALIDEKVAEFYKSTDKWKDESFINAAQLLIEDWGDKHKGTFEEKFPRVFDDKEKILMNVVWKKEKRELMLTLNNTLSEEQLKFVIENSTEIKTLSEANQKLFGENEELKKQILELQRQVGVSDAKTIEEENEILKKKLKDVGVESPLPTPVEVIVQTSTGSCSMVVKERQYSGLSLEEIVAYVSEAKMDVVNYFKELNDREGLGMRFDTERIAMDSFSQLYGIYDRDGNEIPLVVHSYKGPQYRYFDLNWYDWNLLSRKGSMLWVKTITGLQCIPLYALPIRNFNIAIGNNTSQIEQAKLLTLATVGKEYAYIGFEFGNNMPRNFKEHVAFDYIPNELRECIGSIKQICDDNASRLVQLYNFGPNIPLLESSNQDYSIALQSTNEDCTMRDLHDLPANDIQPPIKGAGLASLL